MSRTTQSCTKGMFLLPLERDWRLTEWVSLNFSYVHVIQRTRNGSSCNMSIMDYFDCVGPPYQNLIARCSLTKYALWETKAKILLHKSMCATQGCVPVVAAIAPRRTCYPQSTPASTLHSWLYWEHAAGCAIKWCDSLLVGMTPDTYILA